MSASAQRVPVQRATPPTSAPVACSEPRLPESIGKHHLFALAVMAHSDACQRTEAMPHKDAAEENAPAYQLAQHAEHLAYEALIAVIDAYCAAKIAQAFEPAEPARHESARNPR